MRNKNKLNVNKIIDSSSRQRGIDRENHFNSGGTIEAWRGKHSVFKDKKKEASKKSCRKNNDCE